MNNTSMTIKLMYNSSNFADTELPSNVTSVGHLRSHLGVDSRAVVNLDGVVSSDDTTSLRDGGYVAIVKSDKTGGDNA